MGAIRILRRLRELLDVAISSPQDGDGLAYNATSGKWENSPVAGGGVSKLVDLTDVTGTPGTGKAPVSDGAGHFPFTDIATQAELDAEALTRAAADAALQPLDSDLTAIAALATTVFGRALLTLVDAAAARTAIGTAIGTDVEAHDADLTTIAGLAPANDDVLQRKAGAWTNRTLAQLITDLAALGTTFQPLDSDLTAIAALATSAFGRSLLVLADAAALRTAAGLVIGTDVQAHDAELDALAGLVSAANKLPYFTGSGTAALADLTAAGRALIDDADAAAQRTTLGLVIGTDVEAHDTDLTTIAGLAPANDDVLQRKAGAWANRTIAQLLTDLAAAGTTFQPLDSELTALAGLVSAADKLPYFTGAGTAALTTLSSFIRTLLDDTDAATARTTLGLAIGTDVQAHDAELDALAALVSAANKLPYFTGSGAASLADLTAAGRALIDDADAAAQRTTLGLAIGTDVQAHDAELDALAALVSAANKLPYFTGSGAASLADLTAAGRALIDDADAAAQRTTLGLGGLATLSAISTAEITDGTITAADLSTAAIQALTGRNSAWTVIRKASDTSRATTTTVAADPELVATFASGVIYEFMGLLYYDSSSSTPDIKIAFGEDSTIRGAWHAQGMSTSDTAGVAETLCRTNSSASFGTGNPGGGSTKRLVFISGWYNGSGNSAGVYWSQATSDGTNTTMLIGSILAYRALP